MFGKIITWNKPLFFFKTDALSVHLCSPEHCEAHPPIGRRHLEEVKTYASPSYYRHISSGRHISLGRPRFVVEDVDPQTPTNSYPGLDPCFWKLGPADLLPASDVWLLQTFGLWTLEKVSDTKIKLRGSTQWQELLYGWSVNGMRERVDLGFLS